LGGYLDEVTEQVEVREQVWDQLQLMEFFSSSSNWVRVLARTLWRWSQNGCK